VFAFKGRVGVNLTDDQRAAVEALSKQDGITYAAAVRRFLVVGISVTKIDSPTL
jgi:hypothetical protein